MHGQLVRKQVPAAGRLDRVHVPDDVGDGHVGRGQFFHVALVPREPGDGRTVSLFFQQEPPVFGDGLERVVVDLATGEHGNFFVQQRHQRAENTALRLAAQSQQDEVVARQHGVDHLGDHRLFKTDDAGKDLRARFQQADEIFPHLVLDRPAVTGRASPLRLPELTQSAWFE